ERLRTLRILSPAGVAEHEITVEICRGSPDVFSQRRSLKPPILSGAGDRVVIFPDLVPECRVPAIDPRHFLDVRRFEPGREIVDGLGGRIATMRVAIL